MNRNQALTQFVIHALIWGVVLYCRLFIAILFAIPTTLNILLNQASPSLSDVFITVALLVTYQSYPLIYIVCLLYGIYAFYKGLYPKALRVIKIPGWVFLITIILYALAWLI